MRLCGTFDFHAHCEFRRGLESLLNTPGIQSIIIDLVDVDYLETAALGMLLLAKERADVSHVGLHLTKCPDQILKLLILVNFGKVFKLV